MPDVWKNKAIDITTTWGDDRWFRPPSGKPSFRLHCINAGQNVALRRYHVEFDSGNMTDCWQYAWLLGIGRGPAYTQKGSMPPTPAGEQLDRLEGFMPVVVDGAKRVDHILMEYYRTNAGDIVYVYLQYADGQYHVLEEGGGSGPPH